MNSLADHDVASLRSAIAAWGRSPSHATTLLRAFWQGDGEFDLASLRVGNELAARISGELLPLRSREVSRHVSSDGTIKLFVGFERGGAAEAVLMPTARDGIAAACLSSQIGCAMGCDFCASTRGGLERDLSAGEIVEQFLRLRRAARASGRRLRTVVFMGMGEPLLNLDNVVGAIQRIADGAMGSLGFRQISVSTVGIVPGIDRLAEMDLKVHLALSLHAPDDATRSRIVPVNRRYSVAEIMAAAKRYSERSGQIVNIEYCMLDGITDSLDQARMLCALMKGFRAHVNLIPYNAIGVGLSGISYRRPSAETVDAFLRVLRDDGVCAHVRVTRGEDVGAACGQLRVLEPQA